MNAANTTMRNNAARYMHIAFVGLAALLAIVVLFQVSLPPKTYSADEYAEQAWHTMKGGTYNIVDAQLLYERALSADPKQEQALYNIARIYYITGAYEKSLSAVARYKEAYPDNRRIHYIAGLANAYAGDLVSAQGEFEAFIASGNASWPGYLDLAWVHFQQGEFTAAEHLLAGAVKEFGGNVWLNTSLGGVHVALGNTEQAIEYLDRAEEQLAHLTEKEWRKSYSFNDPMAVGKEIKQMGDVIAYNRSRALGEDPALSGTEMLRVAFADMSNEGLNHGFVVSACADSCAITQCVSPANICGQVGVGTASSCGGNVCSATVPPNPAGTCAVETQCGNAPGVVGCNGGCNITAYPMCLTTTIDTETGLPVVSDQITWVVLNDASGNPVTFGATVIAAQIETFPVLVASGQRTVVRWISTETVSCEVVGTNGDIWTGPVAGEQVSGILTEETTYTLTCEGYDGSTVVDEAIVRIIPDWEEF